ncbi:MAG: DUF1800 family protein [Akkermansiaceae bacterium]|jgi:uncharacterized protein (DUF1800 family)/formylglycine-generating enzyme required for sulfatase activity|nr:DUF1800 family protein [Akkermansiaceae bacterium]
MKKHLPSCLGLLGILYPQVHGQLSAPEGLNLNGTGYILGSPVQTAPDGQLLSWDRGSWLQSSIVPVGQLTGILPDGSLLQFEDLVPLRASSLTVVTGNGGTPPTGVSTRISGDGIQTHSLSLLDPAAGVLAVLGVNGNRLLLDGKPLTGSTEDGNRALAPAAAAQTLAEVSGGTLTTLAGASGLSLPLGSFLASRTEVTFGEWFQALRWALQNGYSFGGNATTWWDAGGRATPHLSVQMATAGTSPVSIAFGSATNGAIAAPGGHSLGSHDHPVVGVSWVDAVKWCNARSEMDGFTPVYAIDSNTNGNWDLGEPVLRSGSSSRLVEFPGANGYRLPTSAQWEWMARSGSMSLSTYPWGPVYHSGAANAAGANHGMTTRVGSFPAGANGFGLHDLAGNVAEWCFDSSGTALQKVVRGGAWNSAPDALLLSSSSRATLTLRSAAIGFRVIRIPGSGVGSIADPPPASIATFDLNGDGTNEVWQAIHGNYGPSLTQDADGDGLTAAEEAAAWTDPYDPDSALALTSMNSGSSWVVSWPTQAGLRYDLQWRPSETSAFSSIGFHSGTGEVLTVTLPLSSFSGPSVAFRVLPMAMDSDSDGVDDATELVLGWSPTSATSVRAGYNGGDGRALLELLQGASPDGRFPGAPSGTPMNISDYNAARFLAQATWGVDQAGLGSVKALGYQGWIDQQRQATPSKILPYIDSLEAMRPQDQQAFFADFNYLNQLPYPTVNEFICVHSVSLGTGWMRNIVHKDDQLRQRIAWALSQIFVVSRKGFIDEAVNAQGLAAYYDMLASHAFGNYRTLLKDVTMHPTMGWYLSHLGNQKADPSLNRYPDENYAREIMQLFSIGLWELNPDGTPLLDNSGKPIPTYDNETIKELARVMTGFWFSGNSFFDYSGADAPSFAKFRVPMALLDAYHDQGPKEIVGGLRLNLALPGGQSAQNEVDAAIDALFHHPNCGPFISRRLIQFLVKSNPTPEYVARVSAVFANNGAGVRGDLFAVVKAILLDPEARNPLPWLEPAEGKLSEPMLRLTRAIKAFEAGKTSPNLEFWARDPIYSFKQGFLNSDTVFNFFQPDFSKSGALADLGLSSPEFQILDTSTAISGPNLWDYYLSTDPYAYHGRSAGGTPPFTNDYRAAAGLAPNLRAAFDWLSLRLCQRIPSAAERDVILAAAEQQNSATDRIRIMAWLLLNSPAGSNSF